MKNNIKHPHFRHKLEYYLKGLITGKYKLREVSVYTGYTIQHLSRLKKKIRERGKQSFNKWHKGIKVSERYFSKKEKTSY